MKPITVECTHGDRIVISESPVGVEVHIEGINQAPTGAQTHVPRHKIGVLIDALKLIGESHFERYGDRHEGNGRAA